MTNHQRRTAPGNSSAASHTAPRTRSGSSPRRSCLRPSRPGSPGCLGGTIFFIIKDYDFLFLKMIIFYFKNHYYFLLLKTNYN